MSNSNRLDRDPQRARVTAASIAPVAESHGQSDHPQHRHFADIRALASDWRARSERTPALQEPGEGMGV